MVRQAGATGVVTALYDVPPGTVWTRTAIAARKAAIEAAGLRWEVVESLPVSEAIKTGAAQAEAHLDAYRASLRNLHAEGLRVVCYNLMPVIDWTRTDLDWRTPTGASALRYDRLDLAAFDAHVLRRPDAARSEEIDARAHGWDEARRDAITRTILAGLPGAVEGWTLDAFRARRDAYDGADALRANAARFLRAVIPMAEELGIRLCCHPDDPPWPVLGLPRIVSTEADYAALLAVAPSPANGITFCTGSLGARPDVDLPGMMERLGAQVHFLHLRNVAREEGTVPGSFHEADHLDGSTDMVAVVRAVLAEEARRRAEGRADAAIPMRPDHGHRIGPDTGGAPGYPYIGRLRGLAELRGVEAACR
nr:mannonate dehydratase [Jannaschia sp. Os4]